MKSRPCPKHRALWVISVGSVNSQTLAETGQLFD